MFPLSVIASRVFRRSLPSDFQRALSAHVPECPDALKVIPISTAEELVAFCRSRPDACRDMGSTRAFMLMCRVAASENGTKNVRDMLTDPSFAKVFVNVVKKAIAPRLISGILKRNLSRVQRIASPAATPAPSPDMDR